MIKDRTANRPAKLNTLADIIMGMTSAGVPHDTARQMSQIVAGAALTYIEKKLDALEQVWRDEGGE